MSHHSLTHTLLSRISQDLVAQLMTFIFHFLLLDSELLRTHAH